MSNTSNTLAILIAKSGVALLDLLPREWEVVVADYSRLDQRLVQWWSRPRAKRYDEIIILDQNVTTGLTQLRLERELQCMGVEGPVRYAGNPKTLLAYRHMDYVLGKEGLMRKAAELHGDPYNMKTYMVALVGLPAAGKTLLRYLFSRIEGFSCYKWGKYLLKAVEERLGPIASFDGLWDKVVRFTDEVEAIDRLAVARSFLEHSGCREDSARFLVVDGVKSREQLIYVSYALRRPVVIVRAERDEEFRKAEVAKRGDPDDLRDAERLEVLRRMGALDVVEFADFVVETTGCETLYDSGSRTAQIIWTERFLRGMHEVLSWIFVSPDYETTKQIVCNAAQEVAHNRGYAATVERR